MKLPVKRFKGIKSVIIVGQFMAYIKALVILLVVFSAPVAAETTEIKGKVLSKIRAVGDYPGSIYDHSVELWFSTPIVWPVGMNCTDTRRVYIDAKHSHLISAAYMAFASGSVVNFYADDQLTLRNGSCEISFLDVVN